MKTTFALVTAGVCLMFAATGVALDQQNKAPALAADKTKTYIVQMTGDPIVAYDGGIAGLAATRPGKGAKVDPNSTRFQRYARHLEDRHNQALHSVGATQPIHHYKVTFNGFAANLTHQQVGQLKTRPDVVAVYEDRLLKPQTDSTPAFLGLSGGGEPWRKGIVGEGVVIAMIDTGIQPDHPSLADVPTREKGAKGQLIPYGPPPAGFSGTGCEFGNTAFNPNDAPFTCNNKLLKAEFFADTFVFFTELADGEFLSARDSDGHGTHTATIAGGNFGVAAELNGMPAGTVSGIAPRARIAVYKVCWDAPDPDDSGCFSSDSMAAIDQAVADGADVINFSIGGSSTSFNGADDIAFLFAADAGVFVATSAGNTGPGAQTIGTPSGVPWITAVGAGEDDQNFGTGLQVNAPASIADTYEGLEGDSPVQLSDTGTIGAGVVPAQPLNACGPLSNAAAMSGNIALVIRGVCNFDVKYNQVAAAGGIAIVVFNDGTTPARIDPIVMFAPGTTIPGIMTRFPDGTLINTTAGLGAVSGTLSPDILVPRVNRITGFSSRGPNGGARDIIKPDVAAPGVDILAGETLFPNVNNDGGSFFQLLSGTSMASPHAAGAFALLKQAHPDWTPAIAKSALMTTARQNMRKSFGDDQADPFDIGAGTIVPEAALNPLLAYDTGLLDYVAFMCGAGNQPPVFTPATCDLVAGLGFPLDSSDLNQPAIGIGELAGAQTVRRTVTSVTRGNGNKRYTASVEPPPGVDVVVSPSSFRLRRGETATYEVTFNVRPDAVLGEWAFGSLTWERPGRAGVRSPIAVRPVALSAPAELRASGTEGSLSFEVQFGYTGPYQLNVDGLAAGAAFPGAVPDGEADLIFFTIPAGTTLARIALFDEDVGAGDGSDDLDLQIFGPQSAGFPFLGSSGGPTSEEEFNIVNPTPGLYAVFVIDFASAAGPTPYTLFNFNLNGADAGNTAVAAPANAVLGTSGRVTVNWLGLAAGTRHLGILNHNDGAADVAETEVLIDAQ